jgi:hypothetical protein
MLQNVLRPGTAVAKMGLCAQRRLMTELKGTADPIVITIDL